MIFGEQIGWIDPAVIKEPGNADFLKRIVAVRRRFAEYFYAGEMARPPKLQGEIPKIRADWQWSGEWWVTTDAVLAGAWRQPQAKRLLLLFVNVSDQTVKFKPLVDLVAYGVETSPSDWLTSNPDDGAVLRSSPNSTFGDEMTAAPQQIQAIQW